MASLEGGCSTRTDIITGCAHMRIMAGSSFIMSICTAAAAQPELLMHCGAPAGAKDPRTIQKLPLLGFARAALASSRSFSTRANTVARCSSTSGTTSAPATQKPLSWNSAVSSLSFCSGPPNTV